MSDKSADKAKLLNRVRRIRGQVDAIQRALDGNGSSVSLLQQATACRGALDGFIAEVIEDHIREHLVDPAAPRTDPRAQAAEDLVAIVHSYLT